MTSREGGPELGADGPRMVATRGRGRRRRRAGGAGGCCHAPPRDIASIVDDVARRRWIESAVDPDAAARLAHALKLHPLAARVLAARGLAEPAAAEAFLAARLADLPDPFAMKGMEAAVARIVRALEAGERIACYGDYDVDGVTSTALLVRLPAGRRRGRRHLHAAPARRGLRPQPRGGGEARRRRGSRLLVTLDCGITSVRGGARGRGARPRHGGRRSPHGPGRAPGRAPPS